MKTAYRVIAKNVKLQILCHLIIVTTIMINKNNNNRRQHKDDYAKFERFDKVHHLDTKILCVKFLWLLDLIISFSSVVYFDH